jgi:hypothetical protein
MVFSCRGNFHVFTHVAAPCSKLCHPGDIHITERVVLIEKGGHEIKETEKGSE